MLQHLEGPLLCSSIRPLEAMSGALDDGAVLLDQYAPRGLDYVVDDGKRFGEGSSVVDMTVRMAVAAALLDDRLLLFVSFPCMPVWIWHSFQVMHRISMRSQHGRAGAWLFAAAAAYG